MTYADDPDNDHDDVDDNTPGWFSWPNFPIVGVTVGTILGWWKAWRN